MSSKDVKRVKKDFKGVIGFAGMSAPWKGLHELYLWSSLFEKDLVEMGVSEIAVYGKNIYLTEGEHTDYGWDLKRLKKLFPSRLIVHKGLVAPEQIYSEIDVMLHLSNRPEPFGRVIMESFAHGVPCISTGLGGAGELMGSFKELIHFSYDYGGLSKKLSFLFKNKSARGELSSKLRDEYQIFKKLAESDLKIIELTYFQ